MVVGERQAASDAEVEAIEASLPPGTRVLVALGFSFKWPGFGWAADQADWAARHIAGLERWPELGRVVMADPDGEPVWWLAYRSSPAWWLTVLAAIGVFIAAAIAFRVVRWVAPEVAAPIGTLVNLVPALVALLVMALLPGLVRELVPRLKGG